MDFEDDAYTASACNEHGDIIFASVHKERLAWNAGYIPPQCNQIYLVTINKEEEEVKEVRLNIEDNFLMSANNSSGGVPLAFPRSPTSSTSKKKHSKFTGTGSWY